jgi:plasmid stabilization system protein ParE
VAQVVYSACALRQLERTLQLLRDTDPDAAVRAVTAICSAVGSLAAHPLIGRRMAGELRELIISYGATGYLALYRFVVVRDQVRILALCRQRELGLVA